MWIGRHNALLLAVLVCSAGCQDLIAPGGSGRSGGGGTASDPQAALIHDLSDAGRMYHNYIDTHRKGPASWDDFRRFAPDDAAHQAVLDRLQAAGYQFVWNVDLSSGVSMTETRLAQSSSQSAYLLLDGSIGGVSEELFQQAREARKSRTKTEKSSAPPVEVVNYPKPSTPMEQAVYDYLVACERYLAALGKIQNLSSAQQAKAAVRALDADFDDAGQRMAEQGMQVDFLAVPEQYKKAVRDLPLRLMSLEKRLAGLPDGNAINQHFLSDEGTAGPTGPRRTAAKLQAEFARRRGGSGQPSHAQAAPQTPPDAARILDSIPWAQSRKTKSASSVPSASATASINPVIDAADPAPPPAQSAAAPSTPASLPADVRTWTDASGRFTIEARLLSFDGRNVRLAKVAGDDVVVRIDRLSPADRRYLHESGRRPDGAAQAASSSSARFRVDDRVEVKWMSHWLPAVVRQVDGDRYFIHYEKFGDHWDEWVGPERVRK